MTISTGWKPPSNFDARDWVFGLGSPADRRPRVELRHVPLARNQRTIPCCVSMAVTTAMEMVDARTPEHITMLSPLFNYYMARPDSHRLGALELRDGLVAAVQYGICAEPLHPYRFDRPGALAEPTYEAREDASRRRIVSYDEQVQRAGYYYLPESDRVQYCCTALAAGCPVLLGFFLSMGYAQISARKPEHGRVTGVTRGGHAVVATGYDDSKEAFLIKDSGGPEFGRGGCWWFPYDLVASRLVVEAWALLNTTSLPE